MSFNPQIVPADDAPLDDDGSLHLPADLAELAAQLTDDANYLAALYPPNIDTTRIALAPRMPTASFHTPRMALLALVASFVMMILGGWWLVKVSPSPDSPSNLANIQNASSTALEVVQSTESNSADTNPDSIFLELPSANGMMLYEYSGPELEGVYDLLAESPQPEISF